jgi:23S rRNA (cytosine1962-C5)-methyltransferase
VNQLILFEDEHLLAIHKPSGINTHKPDRYAPDGIHEWLVKRCGMAIRTGRDKADSARHAKQNVAPTRATLSILHRLDKDTSGVLVFGKTTKANQSLSRQFESHRIEKQYLFLSASKPSRVRFHAQSGDAVTEFEYVQPHGDLFLIEARPLTGKTHQIRRHAADNGFPIVGDVKYGGDPGPRLMLHAHKLTFEHPATGGRMTIEASIPATFEEMDALTAAVEFRELLFGESGEPASATDRNLDPKGAPTNAFRLVAGAADGFSDVVVDSYAGKLLVQWQSETAMKQAAALYEALRVRTAPEAIYEQLVTKQKRTVPEPVLEGRPEPVLSHEASRPPALGEERPRSRPGGMALQERFAVRENGLTFLINFGEGLSTGLFLDQRENRRRLATENLAGKTVLNCFSYTCGFSVAAARAGAVTTSIDLSRRYLEWGKENFRVNQLDPDLHQFLLGDVFEWLKRFHKRGQTWDVVILDPPTFATTKQGRAFRAVRDYEELEAQAIGVVAKNGLLLCSTNQRTLAPDKFEASLEKAARQAGRVIVSADFETLPFDFRVAERERPYLKTFWARLD